MVFGVQSMRHSAMPMPIKQKPFHALDTSIILNGAEFTHAYPGYLALRRLEFIHDHECFLTGARCADRNAV